MLVLVSRFAIAEYHLVGGKISKHSESSTPWPSVKLNQIITAGACRSLKESERVGLQRGVGSYQLKNSVLKFQQCRVRETKPLKNILPFNYSICGPMRNPNQSSMSSEK